MASLALALHAAIAQPRHGSCQTLITLTRRPLSVSLRASCAHQLLRSDCFCAWRRLLLICWKLLIGVCVRDGLAASVCVYRTSAASVEPRPRGWRAVAFPRWLHDQSESGSTWLIVILMRFVVASASCVYEAGLLLVCACRTSAASVEPLPRGSRAVAFPLWLHVLSCSRWLIVRCCINFCVWASLALIVVV